MHELEFCNSFSPAQRRIFGIAMENYAIGHEMALIRQGNPLVTYSDASLNEIGIDAKRIALGMAIEICGKLSWLKKLILAIKISKSSAELIESETEKFKSYRASANVDLPTVRQPRTNGVPFHYFGGPELARLINYVTDKHSVMIQTHFGGSPLNFPLGLARQLYLVHLESEGAIWIENWQDRENKIKREEFEKRNPESSLAVGEDAVNEAAIKWNREHPDQQVPLMKGKK